MSPEKAPEQQLRANLRGDREGLPGWYTHFGSEDFAQSAIPYFADKLPTRYDKSRPLTVVGLGAGSAFYERSVTRALQEDGWNPKLLVSDLQRGSLQTIPQENFPLLPILSDSTRLPLVDGEERQLRDNANREKSDLDGTTHAEQGGTLVLSRAVEHYLPSEIQVGLIAEAGRILRPGELYAAQLSSGEPLAIGALSAGLKGIADKDVEYLTVDAYRTQVAKVVNNDGSRVFKEISVGAADTQTDRGVLAQARRYLNPTFLELHNQEAGDSLTVAHYKLEIAHVTAERDRLRREVQGGADREHAIKELDEVLLQTEAFGFFADVYIRSVSEYLQSQGITPAPGMELPGVRIHGGDSGISDIELDVKYPVVVLEKQQTGVFAEDDVRLLPFPTEEFNAA